MKDAPAVPGEFIVRWSEPLADDKIQKLSLPGGALSFVMKLPLLSGDTFLLKLSKGAQLPLEAPELNLKGAKGHRVYIEPNYLLSAAAGPTDPNDPYFNDERSNGLKRVNAPAAWDRTKGALSVRVAVIDSGIDYLHEDLAGNAGTIPSGGLCATDLRGNPIELAKDKYGAMFIGAPSSDPADDNGHGTHIAGIIAAVGNNDRGMTGMNWRASLLGVKFLNRDLRGSTVDAIRAINYAACKGATVINMSWGGPCNSKSLSQAIEERPNIVFVAAAGNRAFGGGQNTDDVPFYPASYKLPNLVSVQASAFLEGKEVPWESSNFGRRTVDIAAPGVLVLSTLPSLKKQSECNVVPNLYGCLSGTSMSAPYVAGAAALIKALAPGWSGADIKSQIVGSARPVSGLAGMSVSGGILDVDAATQAPLVISSPTAGSGWSRSSTIEITWHEKFEKHGCKAVDLWLSTDGGENFVVLAGNIDTSPGRTEVQILNVRTSRAIVRLACSGTKLYAFSPEFVID